MHEWIGLIAGALSNIAFLPQLYETYHNPQAKGLALGMCLLNFISFFLWMLYGAFISSLPVFLTNVIGVILCGVLCFLKLSGRIRNKQ
ncbi:MAG: hypothetical protein LBH38_03285 [Holosporales bacterium]|jgi:MtN3 and saliva related transmembrane protein|nr:hypothetical protein [Holosporales bacterium]